MYPHPNATRVLPAAARRQRRGWGLPPACAIPAAAAVPESENFPRATAGGAGSGFSRALTSEHWRTGAGPPLRAPADNR